MTKHVPLRQSILRIVLSVIVAVSLSLGIVPAAQHSVGQDGDNTVYAAVNKSFTGWKTIKGKPVYYLADKKANGLVTVKENVFYFKKGVSQKGWQKVGNYKLYFKKVAKGKYSLSKSKNIKSKLVKLNTAYSKFSKTTFSKGNAYHKYKVGHRKVQFYFNNSKKLYKGTVKNAHVLELKGKLYYVKANGAIDPKNKIILFDKFNNGAWFRVYEYKRYGVSTLESLFRFGSKKLTGDKKKDAAAWKLYRECYEAVKDTNPGEATTEDLTPLRKKFDVLWSYDWPKYATKYDPYPGASLVFTGNLKNMELLMRYYYETFYRSVSLRYSSAYQGIDWYGRNPGAPFGRIES